MEQLLLFVKIQMEINQSLMIYETMMEIYSYENKYNNNVSG